MFTKLQSFPWKRLYSVAAPYWTSQNRNTGLRLLLIAVICVVSKVALTVYVNDVNGNVWGALKNGSESSFWLYLALNFALVGLLMPCEVIGNMCKTILGINWRQYLSNEFFASYFAGMAALRLEQSNATLPEEQRIDNPEWRMTSEVASLTDNLIAVFFAFLDAIITVGTMAAVLYQISPKLTLLNVAYALGGSVIAAFITKSLTALNEKMQKSEGSLRAGLTESRNQAGTIASYRAQEIVLKLAGDRQKNVVETAMSIMLVNRNMQCFTALYYPLAPLLPLAIMGALYLANPSLDFASIAKAQNTFNSMFVGMAVFVGQTNALKLLSALCNRLGTLLEFLQEQKANPIPAGQFIEVSEGSNAITCDGLTVSAADGSTLVKDLTFHQALEPGQGVLIRGPQATAKAALLQSFISVWPWGSGKVSRPARRDVMTISQKPFMQPMSLRTALSYPSVDETTTSDARIREILQLVDLSELLASDKLNLELDREYNFAELLSDSKQQRLAIARIINKKPKFVLIDEAANAMEPENEKLLISLIKTLGINFFIAGNGPDLVKYASWILEIESDGSTRLLEAHDYKPTFWRSVDTLLSRLGLDHSENKE